MSKRMLIDATHSEELRVAVVENDSLVDFDFENSSKRPLKGNIYLGKIVRIEPSLQAAFVDYGGGRHGFLAFTEIHPDYFRIPVADRPADEEEAEEVPLEEEVIEVDGAQPETAGEDSVDGDLEEEVSPDSDDGAGFEDDDEEEKNPYRNYKIQEVIKSRQVVLVQVVKEERGSKGAALTTYVSLAGRYCVLMPNADHGGGISRRITDVSDRKRLKQLMEDLEVSDGMSLIVRTAGLDRSKTEIKKDYSYLIKLWAHIREQTLQATAPVLVYEDANLMRRAIRDMYMRDIEEILVDGEDGYKEVKGFMKQMVPSHAKKVQKYEGDELPLFYRYKIEYQIERMHSTEVQLKSGGYIVINPTEALVSIDVNSGRATRERHIDSTALKTNLEAAEEVARQIRLRDYAGLIVIDFIDMTSGRHNQQVEKCLKEALTLDRARVQVGRISQFGLLEMSRQRLRPSIIEATTTPCSLCGGSGIIRSVESFALQLLRALQEVSLGDKALRDLDVYIPARLAIYLLNEKRHMLSEVEERFQLRLDIKEDETLTVSGFRIESNGRTLADGSGLASDEPTKGSKKRSGSRRSKSDDKPGGRKDKPAKEKRVPQNKKEAEKSSEEEDSAEKQNTKGPKRSRNRRRNRRGSGGNTAVEVNGNVMETPQGQEDDNIGNNRLEPVKEEGVFASEEDDNIGNRIDEPAAEAKGQSKGQQRRRGSQRRSRGGQQRKSAAAGNTSQQGPTAPGNRKRGWWQRLLDS